MSCVELSLYVPVAMNCCVSPRATDGFSGVTAIELRAMTVREVFPETPFKVAVIMLVPPATPVAFPPEVIVATLVVPEVQVA